MPPPNRPLTKTKTASVPLSSTSVFDATVKLPIYNVCGTCKIGDGRKKNSKLGMNKNNQKDKGHDRVSQFRVWGFALWALLIAAYWYTTEFSILTKY